jgi:3-hydroxybutyrate dehydrogenase
MCKKVLVTGGTGSIGRVICKNLMQHGMEITFQYNNNIVIANELIAYGNKLGVKCTGIKANFIYDDIANKIPSTFDILINNAGINNISSKIHKTSWDDWDSHLFLNTTIPFRLCSHVLKYMIGNNFGRIININSVYGKFSTIERGAYITSKHALSGLTKSIAKEYGEYNITCNEILPTAVNSEMIDRISRQGSAQLKITESEYRESLIIDIPTGRFCEPIDIFNVIIFLISNKSSYINGDSIRLDGGQHA